MAGFALWGLVSLHVSGMRSSHRLVVRGSRLPRAPDVDNSECHCGRLDMLRTCAMNSIVVDTKTFGKFWIRIDSFMYLFDF